MVNGITYQIKSNNRLGLLCPFFGKINKEQFFYWGKSCELNKGIDFIVLTDDEEILNVIHPENVVIHIITWDKCKENIRSKLGFDVCFAYPYKLCDLKPAYGYLFSEYLKEYDFWGHVDMTDTILGNLWRFLSDSVLEKYDKIHIFGHFTLYRNTKDCNKRFMLPSDSEVSLQELMLREEVTGFDEMWHPWSINSIYKKYGFKLLETITDLVADILPSHYRFRLYEDGMEVIPRVFEWGHDGLYELTVRDGIIHKKEIGYVHYQKRKMQYSEISHDTERFYIIPNAFVAFDHELQEDEIVNYSKDKVYLYPIIGRIKRILWYGKHPDAFLRKLRERTKRH